MQIVTFIYYTVCLYMMCMCEVGMHVPWHACRNQSTVFKNQKPRVVAPCCGPSSEEAEARLLHLSWPLYVVLQKRHCIIFTID